MMIIHNPYFDRYDAHAPLCNRIFQQRSFSSIISPQRENEKRSSFHIKCVTKHGMIRSIVTEFVEEQINTFPKNNTVKSPLHLTKMNSGEM